MQFNFFGLKRLIATGYSVGDGSLTNQINFKDLFLPKKSYYFDIEKVSSELSNLFVQNSENSLSNDKLLNELKLRKLVKELKEDGDFRSEECIDLLKQSDIVITNPPFSLFREYVEQLFNYNKKFLIIGNMNAITYKEIFKHIKNNELWLGFHNNKTVEFGLSPNYEKYDRIENGKKFGKVPSISWFTNLEISKRDEPLILYKKYYNSEEDKNNPNYINPAYPKYDNYDAIEVSKVIDIPVDYYGVMGVPITFLDKYTPKQFDIVKFRKGDDEKDLVYRKQEFLKEDIERERERIQSLQNNSTLLQSTCSSSLAQIEELAKIKMEYMEKAQYSKEKKLLNDYLLNEFEILGTSDRGGDDYEEIAKIRLTEKKEDSCKIIEKGKDIERERVRKLYKRIFIRRCRN